MKKLSLLSCIALAIGFSSCEKEASKTNTTGSTTNVTSTTATTSTTNTTSGGSYYFKTKVNGLQYTMTSFVAARDIITDPTNPRLTIVGAPNSDINSRPRFEFNFYTDGGVWKTSYLLDENEVKQKIEIIGPDGKKYASDVTPHQSGYGLSVNFSKLEFDTHGELSASFSGKVQTDGSLDVLDITEGSMYLDIYE